MTPFAHQAGPTERGQYRVTYHGAVGESLLGATARVPGAMAPGSRPCDQTAPLGHLLRMCGTRLRLVWSVAIMVLVTALGLLTHQLIVRLDDTVDAGSGRDGTCARAKIKADLRRSYTPSRLLVCLSSHI